MNPMKETFLALYPLLLAWAVGVVVGVICTWLYCHPIIEHPNPDHPHPGGLGSGAPRKPAPPLEK